MICVTCNGSRVQHTTIIFLWNIRTTYLKTKLHIPEYQNARLHHSKALNTRTWFSISSTMHTWDTNSRLTVLCLSTYYLWVLIFFQEYGFTLCSKTETYAYFHHLDTPLLTGTPGWNWRKFLNKQIHLYIYFLLIYKIYFHISHLGTYHGNGTSHIHYASFGNL